MKTIICILVVWSVTQTCAAWYSADKILIDNILHKCIKISKKNIELKNNLLLLHAVWDVKKNIGQCGCKSAAISYDVYEHKVKLLISHGILVTLNKKEFDFVISSDNTIYKNSEYLLSINCLN